MASPVIPWIGGKSRLADKILPLFPEHSCYVEPFCGAAALFFLKEPSKIEVLNDINGDLVNLYRVLKHHLEEFVRQFKWAVTSRQVFEWEKAKQPETLTDIQRAARFYYLQKLAFGGKVASRSYGTAATSPPRLNLLRIEEDLSQAHLRLARVNIEHLGWADCVRRYDRDYTLFYLDPPYWETEGYGVEFGLEQYELMAELAAGSAGKMVISVNDHKTMRKAFKGLKIRSVPIVYTVGGKQGRSQKKELIIKNW
ncbi:MAG: DNA adenine methylase [Pseudomonadota bacterium]|nr:DNA adenine methylase [Pseudomonadota bacterium]